MSSDCSPRMDEKGDEQPADLTTDAHKAISTTPATKVAPNDDMDMGDNVNAFTNNDSTIIAQEADEIDNVLDDIQYLNQATVEKNTLAQARRDQKAGEDERDQHIIEKVTVALEKLRQKKLGIANQLGARFVPESKRRTLNVELVKINHKLTEVTADIEIAKDRMKQRKLKFIAQSEDGIDYSRRLKPGETEREFRIRTGLITPFSNIGVGREGVEESELAKELLQEELDAELRTQGQTSDRAPDSHRVLNKPGFQSQDQAPKKIDMSVLPRIRKRKAPGVTSEEKSKKIARRSIAADVADSAPSLGWNQNSSERSTLSPRPQVVVEKEPVTVLASHSDSEVNPADFTTEDEDEEEATFNSRKTREIPVKAALVIDDGNEAAYQRRLAKWVAGRSAAREAEHEKNGNVGQEDDRDEWLKVCPTHEDFTLRDGVVVPGDIWHALYQFQRTGVQWLSELHALESGGIVADEMGLGKTYVCYLLHPLNSY